MWYPTLVISSCRCATEAPSPAQAAAAKHLGKVNAQCLFVRRAAHFQHPAQGWQQASKQCNAFVYAAPLWDCLGACFSCQQQQLLPTSLLGCS